MSTTLLFLALLPGILIIIFIMRKDKVEHEPMGLIVKLLILGAVSAAPAVAMETFMEGLNPGYISGSLEYALYEAFAVAALCEEICKYALLKIGSWRNRNFNYRFDGIVYGVTVAVGFALLENILYVAEGGLSTAIMRFFLAVPLHAFCGLFMGVFYGAAKKYAIDGRKGKAFRSEVNALLIPMLIHGVYDTFAFLQSTAASVSLLAFVVILYIIAVKCVNRYSRDDWKAGFYYNADSLSGEYRQKDRY